jgi:hypothetical protein
VVAVARRPRKLRDDGENWGWIGELSAETRRHVGGITAALLGRGPQWVHRRVETMSFVDDRVVRRHLSVDFTLPKWLRTKLQTPAGEQVFLVPITLLERRDAAMNFDVMDEHNVALPLLTRREDSQLTGAALTELALQALRRHKIKGAVHDDIVAAIAFSSTSTYEDGLPYIRSLISPRSSEWRLLSADSTAQREVLRQDDDFCDFLGAFAKSSLAFVPVVGAAGCHRVLKLSFDEEVLLSRSALSFIGWSPTVVVPTLPLVGLAETYHVQVTPPPNIEFTEAGLSAQRPCELIRTTVGERTASATDTYRRFAGGPIRSVHLYQPRSHQLASGVMWFAIRAERRGLLFGAAVAALLIAAMLTFFGVVTDAIVQQPSSSTSLLLLAPGLVAAYLLRPGEHAMARKLLGVARLLLILEAAMAFAAAATMIALYPEVASAEEVPQASSALEWSLRGLAIGAGALLLLLTASLVLPRARRSDRGDRHDPPGP